MTDDRIDGSRFVSSRKGESMRQFVVLLTLAAVGCGVSAGRTLEPVDITGIVTVGDVPISDVILNLQPTGAGTLPVVIPIKDGKFETMASPGRYAWYFEAAREPKNSKGIESIPQEFRSADLDRQIDVHEGAQLEFLID
jgi:hypothetical protein